MKRQLCANGCGRPPFFRVRGGPIKTDSKHSLCMACYRDQKNSVHAQSRKAKCTCDDAVGDVPSIEAEPPEMSFTMEKVIPWAERHSVLKILMKEKSVVLRGTDLPDPEDPSDPMYISKVYISTTGCGSEMIYQDGGIRGTGIPSLMIPMGPWDKKILSYVKHWLFKVLDDPMIYRGNEIHIETRGGWQENFLGKL